MKYGKIGFWIFVASLIAQSSPIAYAAKSGSKATRFVCAIAAIAASGAATEGEYHLRSGCGVEPIQGNCTTRVSIIQWKCPTGERVFHAEDCPALPYNCSNMNDLPYDFKNETASLPVNEAYTICLHAGAIGPFNNPMTSPRPWLTCRRADGSGLVPGLTIYKDSGDVFIPEKSRIPEDQQNNCLRLSADQTCGCLQICKDGHTFYSNDRGMLTHCLKEDIASWELTRPHYVDENGEDKNYLVNEVEPVLILSDILLNNCTN